MTYRHFAGLNSEDMARATEGEPVLVSYAEILERPRFWVETLLPRLEAGAFERVILDSGAFAVISSGRVIPIEDYATFVARFGRLFDVVVNLDDIAGDLETTHANQAILEAAAPEGVEILPVFHEGEPSEVLEGYLVDHDHIGVGFARVEGGDFANPIAERRAFLAGFFDRVDGRAGVHGFGMTVHALEFPFESVDSTTWIAEYRGLRKRTPGAAFDGTHGVGGELAGRLADHSDLELLEVVVASYSATYRERTWRQGGPEHALARDARGQARTVVRRFDAAELEEVIR